MEEMTGLPFKFRFVQNRQAKGLRSKKGLASESALVLDGEQIPYGDVLNTISRDKRLVLGIAPGAHLGEKVRKELQDGHYVILEVSKIEVRELERYIDRQASAVLAEKHRQELIAEGKGHLFRAITCPHCQATIDVTDLEQTAYTYCRFCESILDREEAIVSHGESHRVCDECGLFGRVKGYTVFYFYFFLVVYGYSYKRRHLCDSCAVRQARKSFLLNFLFLLGVPSAISMWIRATRGREQELKDLAKANSLAGKGKYQEADALYERLLEQRPDHPGILFNRGVAHLKGNDTEGAYRHLGQSIQACNNYLPTLQLAREIQQASNQSAD